MNELRAVEEQMPMEINHFGRQSRLDDSFFSKHLAQHYMHLAKKLASSELVPKGYRGKPQDLFIAWAMGYQIGLAPEQAMQCIAIINGKPAMWGDDMLALCMAHKDFEDIIEEPMLNNSKEVVGYTCTVKRRGMAPKMNPFTLETAKKAGLLAKGGVWTQYPERMLKLRARGFTLRDAFPDALKGIKPREEVEDYIDGELVQPKSRTELLKKDIVNKQGVSNVDAIYGSVAVEEHKVTIETDIQDAAQSEENEVGDETPDLHSEVERLFAEKELAEERIAKALAYYEATVVSDLSPESAAHLIEKLNKI